MFSPYCYLLSMQNYMIRNAEATEFKKKVSYLKVKLYERNIELTELDERVNTMAEQKITALEEKKTVTLT